MYIIYQFRFLNGPGGYSFHAHAFETTVVIKFIIIFERGYWYFLADFRLNKSKVWDLQSKYQIKRILQG